MESFSMRVEEDMAVSGIAGGRVWENQKRAPRLHEGIAHWEAEWADS
jgi:hypothetical protein